MTVSEIQQSFALPQTPTAVSIVSGYAPGGTAYVGTAASNTFGPGGGLQIFGGSKATLAEDSTVSTESALSSLGEALESLIEALHTAHCHAQ